jgi:NADH-quinone oxidoreductase subunit A
MAGRRQEINVMNQNLVAVVAFGALGLVFAALPLVVNRIFAPRKPGAVKLDAYECGTQTVGDPWSQFGVQYYVYALLFVVFDVEVVFLFPWATVYRQFGTTGLVEMGVFLGILVVGLVYAWGTGTLEWD